MYNYNNNNSENQNITNFLEKYDSEEVLMLIKRMFSEEWVMDSHFSHDT